MMIPNARPARFAAAALMLALPLSFDAAAQEECSFNPSAVIVNSAVDCSVSLGNAVRLINTAINGDSTVGFRSVVLGGSLRDSTLSDDVSVFGAKLEGARIGSGSVIESGADVTFSEVGERVRIERGARLRGGRNIDIVRVSNDVIVEAGAQIQLRSLGVGSVIGRGATIGESTDAGDYFRFGARSVWVIGGTVGDGVTVGRNSTLNGGFNAGNGVSIGNSVEVGLLVRIGAGTTLRNNITIGRDATIGTTGVIGNRTVLGEGVMVGDSVLIGNNVDIAPNVSIGSFSIIDAGARVGADVPQNSRVKRNGSVSPVNSDG